MAPPALPLRGAEFYQWMRNREGGQAFGTRSVVAPLEEAVFNTFFKSHLRWFYASSAAAYRARHPQITHVLLYQTSGKGNWKLADAGDPETMRPRGRSGRMFARRVTTFGTPSAIDWGRTADSDVYPIGSYELESGPAQVIGRSIPGFSQLRLPNPLIMAGLAIAWVGILGFVFGDKTEKDTR
jgi:hypothetical protein